MPLIIKMLNDTSNWPIRSSFYIQECVPVWNWYEKFICPHLILHSTHRYLEVLFSFPQIPYDNDLCRLVIPILCLSVINFVDPVKCYFA